MKNINTYDIYYNSIEYIADNYIFYKKYHK